eukprot:CCRYP_011152-RA/>CCRYP_011152-RA protein AED:0.31 eAED:0.31 QI:0/0/0/1/1/1/2/0/815
MFDTNLLSSPSADTLSETKYVINLDNGTTTECLFAELAPKDSPVDTISSTDATDPFATLPRILQRNAKITIYHNGQFHKGYLAHDPTSGYSFIFKRSPQLKKIACFLRPNSSNNAPSASHVSAANLLHLCPPSLAKALHPTNPDRHIWLASYHEEKEGLEAHDVYETISKKDYLHLRRTGRIGKALPSMCVFIIKHDKDDNPVRAKSRIVVLGNFEDRIYEKSQRYAPVLKYSSLRLLLAKSIRAKRVLQQGDCKNAFCDANLPEDEATIVKPPVGDPAFSNNEYLYLKKTLYGLCRSPFHWYNMITTILKQIGLTSSPHDPCLFSGIVIDSAQPNPQHPNRPPSPTSVIDTPPSLTPIQSTVRKPIHVGLYVDDFVFFSEDENEERIFKEALTKASKVKVDFMGTVDYFLGTAFNWKRHADGNLSVLLSQSAFIEYAAHRFAINKVTPTPNMTPYRSGVPIDYIPPPDPKDPDLKRHTKCYQGIVGCINWLATCTRQDISPAFTFLASYNCNPSHEHYKSAIHTLKYLYSTSEYGISFHSSAQHTIQAFNHFPHHHDKEAYSDASPSFPSPADCNNLTAFSDACWGGQFGNAVPDDTPLELFKFRSLSGYIICCTGGPITWKSIRQNQTANSSCVAEINATHECVSEILSLKHRAIDLGFPDATSAIPVYNDNKVAVDRAASVTLKGTKHINLHENCVREAHQSGVVTVKHIPGVCRCRDSFMVSKSNFMPHQHCIPSHLADHANLPYYSIRSALTPSELALTLPSSTLEPSHQASWAGLAAGSARTVSDRPSVISSERGVMMSLPQSHQVLSH